MRRFIAFLAVLALLTAPLELLADPGAGLWTGTDCRKTLMTARYDQNTCHYQFGNVTTDSEILVLEGGPWQFCVIANIAADTTNTLTLNLRHVVGDSDTTNEAAIVNNVTLDGVASTSTQCIYQLGAGRYWVDILVATGGPTAIVTMKHM